MNEFLKSFVFVAIIGSTVFGMGFGFILLTYHLGNNISPEGAFNNHIQAFTDRDWELTHSYLASDCDITVKDIERTWEFQPAIDPDEWPVDKEFVEDDEALLWFEGRGLQYMVKEDGDWKVSCTGEIQ